MIKLLESYILKKNGHISLTGSACNQTAAVCNASASLYHQNEQRRALTHSAHSVQMITDKTIKINLVYRTEQNRTD